MIGGVSDRPYLNVYLNNQLITDLVIPECVTKIADGAFSGCTSLTSVTIPNTVTDIGDGAFGSCLSLTSIKIGNSVKNIGREAFLHCYKLVEVINNSEHITVTKGSEQNSYIGYYALSVSNRDSSYQSKISNDNGFIVYNEGEQKLLLGIKDTKIQLVIPSYVTKIYPYACINQLQLASVVIGESVTEIGEHAFRMCIKLVEVINNSSHITVTKGSEENGCVGCFALSVSNCDSSYKSKLSYDNDFIVYDNDNQKVLINYKGTQTKLTIPYGITQINQGAFYGCASLTSIEIPDSVTAIGVGAFYGCASLTSIEIPNSVTTIGNSAFHDCTSLTSVIIPKEVTFIGGFAFHDCSPLLALYYKGSQSEWNQISSDSSEKDPESMIYYYSESQPNEEGNFWHYVDGEIVVWDAVVSEATPNEYFNFTLLSNNTYEISLKVMPARDVPSNIVIPSSYEGKPVTVVRSIRGVDNVVSVVIPDSVTTIGERAFRGCSALTSIKISNSVKSIALYAFDGCEQLTNIYITDLAAWLNISGLEYLMAMGETLHNLYLNNELLTEVVIPDSVTEICDYAFAVSSIKSVIIPNSVTTIGMGAFVFCSSLTSVHIPSSVTTIKYGAFSQCCELKQITVDSNNESFC